MAQFLAATLSKCALSRQTRPDCRGFSGILNVADGKRQNPQLIRGPAGGVRVASRRPCQQRITPVFDRDRMTRMSTAKRNPQDSLLYRAISAQLEAFLTR